MSSNSRPGLILHAAHPGLSSGPLRAGADVSWLSQCRVGDDQGNTGACSVFALANWSEIMHGKAISDADILEVYLSALKANNLPPRSGLSFGMAFAAAHSAGWLPGARALQAVRDLAALQDQPLIAGYTIRDAWYRPSTQGCLDHDPALTDEYGYHAVVIVGYGRLDSIPGGPWIYIQNSWGLRWGWNGIGVMSEALHLRLCRELWTII